MQSAVIAVLALVLANAFFGYTAAILFAGATYKFRASRWLNWAVGLLVANVALAIASASTFMAIAVIWSHITIAVALSAAAAATAMVAWLTALCAFAIGYRIAVNRRLLRILDAGIAVGLH